jgi:uncharacterized iron-regulated membrane protein
MTGILFLQSLWPRKKHMAKQRFKFDWKKTTKWRRKNYDLHSILGFYASWIVIFIAITGLAWAFPWMDKALYAVSSGGSTYKTWEEPKSTSQFSISSPVNLIDSIYADAQKRYGSDPKTISIYIPQNDTLGYGIYLNPSSSTFYKSASYYYDVRNGTLLKAEHFEGLNAGEQLRNMYYDIHIGKIWGIPGQILVCAGSLTVASLPITGLMIWLGKRRKKAPSFQHQMAPAVV